MPVEGAWRIVKQRTRAAFAKQEHRPHSNKEVFAELQRQWWLIPQWKLDKLITSMPERVNDCYNNDGGHTKW